MTERKTISAFELVAGDVFTVDGLHVPTSRPMFVDWIDRDFDETVGVGIVCHERGYYWISIPHSQLVTVGLTNRWAKRQRANARRRHPDKDLPWMRDQLI